MKLLLVLIFSILCTFYSNALNDSINISFRKGYTYIEEEFSNNEQNLEKIKELLKQSALNKKVQYIQLNASASPEGKYNNLIIEKRRNALIKRLVSLTHIPVKYQPITTEKTIYEELLRLIEKAEKMPYRDAMSAIVEELIECIDNDPQKAAELKEKMKTLYYGEPYWWMGKYLYPSMRYASMKLVGCKNELIVLTENDSCKGLPTEAPRNPVSCLGETGTLYHPFYPKASDHQPGNVKDLYLALKTNALYDAMLVPNIGVEYAFGKRWSIATNWMYAWWKNDNRHRYWRIYGGDAECRYWVGKKAKEKPLQGHHIGVYGQLLTYDIELGSRGYLGDKWSYAFGLSYGYSLPVHKRLNLDFNIGIGYLGGTRQEYVPIDQCYVWQSTKRQHWFGPTKAAISLVWLIGKGNINRKKGGR